MSVWYRAGTVALTNGSKTVTGTGTQWLNLMFGVSPGTTFYGPDGKPYEVDRVVSDTSLLLITNYGGTTASGQNYAIDTTRTGSVASLAAQTSEVLKYSQAQFTQMQTWVTGPANADVTLLSPAGQTVVVPSWKKISDTVAGQAAVAKAEADRAVAAATAASDVVAASALPTPDVWAPLTDSLRLVTGCGRDVKVGDDVVARYVTLSRSTPAAFIDKDGVPQLAAINTPKFERGGLLINGQSTNLDAAGDFLNWSSTGARISATQESVLGRPVFRVEFDDTSSDNRIESNFDVSVSGALTSSLLVRGSRGRTIAMSIQMVGGDLVTSVHTLTGQWQQVSATVQGVTPGRCYFHMRGSGSADSVGSVDVAVHQLENLPFATPPIPTNGTAATRAADMATLPQSLNLGESQLGFSLAVEFDSVNQGSYRVISLSDYSGVQGDGGTVYIRHAGRETGPFPAPLGKRHRIAYTVDYSGSITVCINGKQMTATSWDAGTATSTEKITLGNSWNGANNMALEGHLRDLKIWTKAPLTADQLKVASA